MIPLHFGAHWNMVMNRVKRVVKMQGDSRRRAIIARITAAVISLCGVGAFLQRNFSAYLFMRQMFTYFDDREPLFWLFVSYLAILGLFTVIGYYIAIYGQGKYYALYISQLKGQIGNRIALQILFYV